MRNISKPLDNAENVFWDCVSDYRDLDYRTRLSACKNEIGTAAKEFETKVVDSKLHTLPIVLQIGIGNTQGPVSKEEMIKLYEEQFSKKGKPGRLIYDTIFNSAKNDLCPLCGYRTVASLDHHLPKTKYPALAVVPINLVPCCADCNKLKGATYPQSPETETFHPYFDDVEHERWLYAKIIKADNMPYFSFYVEAPTQWDDSKKAKVKYHFEKFKLNRLYRKYAIEEYSNRHYEFLNLYKKGGAAGLKAYFEEAAISCDKNRLNSWQSAINWALYQSHWFQNSFFVAF